MKILLILGLFVLFAVASATKSSNSMAGWAPAPAPAPAAPKPVSHPAPAPAPVYHPAPAPVYHPAPAPVYHPAPAPVYHPAPAPSHPAPVSHPVAVVHESPVRTVALKEQKTVAKATITTACSNVAASVCVNHEAGKAQVDCHTGVKQTVQKYLSTVKECAADTIKSCACTEQASSSCSTTDTATQDITRCQSDFVKVCGKNCLSTSTSYKSTVAKKTTSLLKKVCGAGDQSEDCKQVVKGHCDEATNQLKKVAVKVSQVKVAHPSILSKKVQAEQKIKTVVIQKHKTEIKATVQNTCDKVAKTVCSSSTGKDYANCHKNTVGAVQKYLKKVETKTNLQIKGCQHDSCVKDTLKVSKSTKKTTEIVGLCYGNKKCEKTVQGHCDTAVEKVKKATGKIHVVTVSKVDKSIQKKAVEHHTEQIKKTVANSCDKVTKYVCSGKSNAEFDSCNKKV